MHILYCNLQKCRPIFNIMDLLFKLLGCLCISNECSFFVKQGCKDAMMAFIEQNAIIMIGVGLGIACLEVCSK